MKSVFLFLIAATLFIACNSDKAGKDKYDRKDPENTSKDDYRSSDKTNSTDKAEDKTTTTTTTTDNTNNDGTVTDEKTTATPNNSGGGWSRADENRFMTSCVGTATKNVGAARAEEYCDCMLFKLEKKYSTYNEADRALTIARDQLQKMVDECNSGH